MRYIMLASLMFLAACASKYKTDVFDRPSTTLSRSGSAYVMLAQDGSYGADAYPGSGKIVTQQLSHAIAPYLDNVEIAPKLESADEAIAVAKANGFTYVFQPVIQHWEERATEWSGQPDRITIKIDMRDVETGVVLASATQSASSKWATFGGDHPQDLVPHLVQTFATEVFQ